MPRYVTTGLVVIAFLIAGCGKPEQPVLKLIVETQDGQAEYHTVSVRQDRKALEAQLEKIVESIFSRWDENRTPSFRLTATVPMGLPKDIEKNLKERRGLGFDVTATETISCGPLLYCYTDDGRLGLFLLLDNGTLQEEAYVEVPREDIHKHRDMMIGHGVIRLLDFLKLCPGDFVQKLG